MTRDELGKRLRAYLEEAITAAARRREAGVLELERLEWVVAETGRLMGGESKMARTPAEQEAKRSPTNHDYVRRIHELTYQADSAEAKARALELALRWDVQADAVAPAPAEVL